MIEIGKTYPLKGGGMAEMFAQRLRYDDILITIGAIYDSKGNYMMPGEWDGRGHCGSEKRHDVCLTRPRPILDENQSLHFRAECLRSHFVKGAA